MFRICKHKTFACSAHPCFHGWSPVNLPSAQFLEKKKLVIFLNNCGCGVTPYWKVLITWGSSFHIGMQLQTMLDPNSQCHVFYTHNLTHNTGRFWLLQAPWLCGQSAPKLLMVRSPHGFMAQSGTNTFADIIVERCWTPPDYCKLCESLHRGMQTG